jgi:hypothetical protein
MPCFNVAIIIIYAVAVIVVVVVVVICEHLEINTRLIHCSSAYSFWQLFFLYFFENFLKPKRKQKKKNHSIYDKTIQIA